MEKIRKAGNRGAFYPHECAGIEKYINIFNKNVDKVLEGKEGIKPVAIISPHAGYVYSGFTANAAHKLLSNSKPETVVVIGPSHYVYFEGVSIARTRYYETPCGNLETDLILAEELINEFSLGYSGYAHFKEHSTETQMPFIAHYNPQAKIIELIYGKTNYYEVAGIINFLLSKKDVAIVISSDLSHFYPLSTAEKLDSVCIEAVAKKDLNILHSGCEACGITGIEAMISAALSNNLKSTIIDYRTSADASGDTSRVVGYLSAAFYS